MTQNTKTVIVIIDADIMLKTEAGLQNLAEEHWIDALKYFFAYNTENV